MRPTAAHPAVVGASDASLRATTASWLAPGSTPLRHCSRRHGQASGRAPWPPPEEGGLIEGCLAGLAALDQVNDRDLAGRNLQARMPTMVRTIPFPSTTEEAPTFGRRFFRATSDVRLSLAATTATRGRSSLSCSVARKCRAPGASAQTSMVGAFRAERPRLLRASDSATRPHARIDAVGLDFDVAGRAVVRSNDRG